MRQQQQRAARTRRRMPIRAAMTTTATMTTATMTTAALLLSLAVVAVAVPLRLQPRAQGRHARIGAPPSLSLPLLPPLPVPKSAPLAAAAAVLALAFLWPPRALSQTCRLLQRPTPDRMPQLPLQLP